VTFAGQVLALQRRAGNRAAGRLLQRTPEHSDLADVRRELDAAETHWDDEYGV
jgi:hypothetical protein